MTRLQHHYNDMTTTQLRHDDDNANDAVQQRRHDATMTMTTKTTRRPSHNDSMMPCKLRFTGLFSFFTTHATHQLTHPTGHPRRDQTINATRAPPHRDPLPSQCPANQCLQGFFHFSLTHATSQLTLCPQD